MMLSRKSLIRFLVKIILIYVFLSLPIPILKGSYEKFYLSLATKTFSDFRESGFTRFEKRKGKFDTVIVMGNKKLVDSNGRVQLLYAPINLKHLAYLPTILFISLVLASPVSWKRMILSLLVGLFITTCMIMYKTWIEIIYLAESTDWLQLSNYSAINKERLEFIYLNFSNYSVPNLFLVVAIWIVVTFRKSDFNYKQSG